MSLGRGFCSGIKRVSPHQEVLSVWWVTPLVYHSLAMMEAG
jgi:hypothetical protein